MGIININIGNIIKGKTNSKHESIEGFLESQQREFDEKASKLDDIFAQYSGKTDEDYASEFDRLVDAQREQNQGRSR